MTNVPKSSISYSVTLTDNCYFLLHPISLIAKNRKKEISIELINGANQKLTVFTCRSIPCLEFRGRAFKQSIYTKKQTDRQKQNKQIDSQKTLKTERQKDANKQRSSANNKEDGEEGHDPRLLKCHLTDLRLQIWLKLKINKNPRNIFLKLQLKNTLE